MLIVTLLTRLLATSYSVIQIEKKLKQVFFTNQARERCQNGIQ